MGRICFTHSSTGLRRTTLFDLFSKAFWGGHGVCCKRMRRFLGAALVLLFGFTLIAPVLVGRANSVLPACCRRAGLHHCSMISSLSGSELHTQSQITTPPCPLFPYPAIVSHAVFFVPDASRLYAGLILLPGFSANIETPYLVLTPSAHQERGPPALSV